MKKILPFLVLLFFFPPKTFAQMTPDCNVALETCKADCAKRQIYDREYKESATRTDFLSQCQSACQDASQWCLKQDSTTSCMTFAYHCQSQCPWSVLDYDHQRMNHTDSFRQCENSCNAGAQACEPFRKSLPPRKRTGDFDVCQEAQAACYADCIVEVKDLKQDFSIIDTDYPDKCAEACGKAVTQCQTSKAEKSCDTYETSCQSLCPSSVSVLNAGSKSDPMVQQWCRNSCAVGRAYCRSLLNLPIDRRTAPALVANPPAATPTALAAAPKPPDQKPSIFDIFKKPTNPPATKPPVANVNNAEICEKAESSCKADCRKNKIINVMSGGFIPIPQRYSTQGTDFWNQCEAACSAAKPTCLSMKGDANTVCNAYKNICRKNCPQLFHDQNGNQLGNNDGENRCQWSCTIGSDWCNNRGEWSICEFAAERCEQFCRFRADQKGSEEFYQACDDSCGDAEEACEDNNFDCEAFKGQCNADCKDDSACDEACTDGTQDCESRSGLSYE